MDRQIELDRQTRDSIGQNRLGNNIHMYQLHQKSDSNLVPYQLIKWMLNAQKTPKEDTFEALRDIVKNLKNSTDKREKLKLLQKYRLRNFRSYH